jgi:hypothetical protein
LIDAPPPDILDLYAQLDAIARDAEALVAGVTEADGTRRLSPGSWSISECLDHLAISNCVYLRAMEEPTPRAHASGRYRRRPARPGVIGGLFVWQLEPPPRWWSRLKSPSKSRPRAAPPLADAYASFIASQVNVRAFLDANAGLDLASIRFRNPFVRGIRFSLATGLHVITAHDRRHLAQAWRVRRALGTAPFTSAQ